MEGFAAGDPMDHDHREGASAARPISISDSDEDVIMLDSAPTPQLNLDPGHQQIGKDSSQTALEHGHQRVSRAGAADNSSYQQQLDLAEDQPQAQKVVWQDTNVESSEVQQYRMIEARRQFLEAQLKSAQRPDPSLSAIVHPSYPGPTQQSANQTPRLLIPNSNLPRYPSKTTVASSSALNQNLQQQGNSVPFTLPTTGAPVHPYPADPTVTVPRSSVRPSPAGPATPVPRASAHTYPADPTATAPRASVYPYPADPTVTVPRNAPASDIGTSSSQEAPLNNSPLPPAPTTNPTSSTDSPANRLGTRQILTPRLPSSWTKISRTPGLSADSSIVGHTPTPAPAFDSTNSSSLANQVYSSWRPASNQGPFVGRVPAHGNYSRLPVTESNKGSFVKATGLQSYQPLAGTEQRPVYRSAFESTNRQSTSDASADRIFSLWNPVSGPTTASSVQAYSNPIPSNAIGSNQTSAASGASNSAFESPSVRAPGARVTPLRSSSPSSSGRIPTDGDLSHWTSKMSLSPVDSTQRNTQDNMPGDSAAGRASGRRSRRVVFAPTAVDRSTFARARVDAQIPPLPQFDAPLITQPSPFTPAPVANNPTRLVFQGPVNQLVTRLAAMARDDGLDQPAPASHWRGDDTSEWIPEHLAPVLHPPARTFGGGDPNTVMRAFWNHTRTNGQYWPLTKVPPHAKSGAPIYIGGYYAQTPSTVTHADGERAWSAAEDQIIFDGTLRGDGWPGLRPLLTTHGRSGDQIIGRIEALRGSPLPRWWTFTHREAQQALRAKKHCGEDPLQPEEWEELAMWVYNGYRGINPRVFDETRCTERLRKEVRAMEDMDTATLIFAASKFPMSQYKGEDWTESDIDREVEEEFRARRARRS
ncbi:MAG: hypothetical protein Q9191_006247 [Dirinaria sp. TL-2023a]